MSCLVLQSVFFHILLSILTSTTLGVMECLPLCKIAIPLSVNFDLDKCAAVRLLFHFLSTLTLTNVKPVACYSTFCLLWPWQMCILLIAISFSVNFDLDKCAVCCLLFHFMSTLTLTNVQPVACYSTFCQFWPWQMCSLLLAIPISVNFDLDKIFESSVRNYCIYILENIQEEQKTDYCVTKCTKLLENLDCYIIKWNILKDNFVFYLFKFKKNVCQLQYFRTEIEELVRRAKLLYLTFFLLFWKNQDIFHFKNKIC